MLGQIQNVRRGASLGPVLKTVVLSYSPSDCESSGVAEKLSNISFEVIDPLGAVHTTSTPVTDTDLVCDRVYFATFTTELTDELGWYTVNWTFTRPNLEVVTKATKFRLLDEAHPLVYGPVQVQDLIDEGVPILPEIGGFSPAAAARKIEKAYRFVESFTGRHFQPTLQKYSADGKGGRMLRLRQPIIHLTKMCRNNYGHYPAPGCTDNGHCYDGLKVYNRHIRQCLMSPDDREAPKIDFASCSSGPFSKRRSEIGYYGDPAATWNRFADDQQNVWLEGIFGYTDPDETLYGCTPAAITEVVILLTMKDLPGLWEQTSGGTAMTTTGPVYQKKTFDQSITFAPLQFASDGAGSAYGGVITGDPRVDRILAQFRAPPCFGAV